MDYYNKARLILEYEKEQSKKVPAIPLFLIHRNQTYLAVIHEVKSPYGNEIVLLNILSYPLIGELENLTRAISEIDKDRLRLTADWKLNLEARLHALRKVDDRLTELTAEQLNYLKRINFTATDSSTGQIHEMVKNHIYEDPETNHERN